MLNILKIISKEDFKYSSWKYLEKEYDLVYISSKNFEELSRKSVQVPISKLGSLDLEKVEVRCSRCGCAYFSVSGKRTISCSFDDSGRLIEKDILYNQMGKPICRGCRNIVGL